MNPLDLITEEQAIEQFKEFLQIRHRLPEEATFNDFLINEYQLMPEPGENN